MKFSEKTPLTGTLILFLLFSHQANAQKSTLVYAIRDTQELKMDIYQPSDPQEKNPCIIFVFGGAFYTGSRDAVEYHDYFKSLADSGFMVASIDYRLGMKNATKPPSLFNRKTLVNAINMAVEDFYTATGFLLHHADSLHIDTTRILGSGSSSGAITVLTADFRKRNFRDKAILPPSFQYAGIISFAGAVYSNHGRPKYKEKPDPVLLFHGNKDDVVPFKKIALFGTGMYGSSMVIKEYRKKDEPYYFIVLDGIGHDAASFPMTEYLPEIHDFLREWILEKRPLSEETMIRDDARKNSSLNFNDVFPKKSKRE